MPQLNGNTKYVLAAIVAIMALVLAAVLGVEITNHGINSSSTPLITTLLGFAAPTLVALLQLTSARANYYKVESAQQNISAIGEALDSHGNQLDHLVTQVNSNSGRIAGIEDKVAAIATTGSALNATTIK